MPNDIIREPPNPIPGSLGHSREPLGIGLVFESVGWKIDPGAMDGGFDEGGDAADGVEGEFSVEVLEAVAFGGVRGPGEVGAVGAVLFVACDWVFC